MTKSNLKQCAICGSDKIKRLENQTTEYKFKQGNKVLNLILNGLSFDKCQNCGEEYLSPDDAKIETQKIKEALANDRRKKGLLTAEEIREIRESLGYSQSNFEKLLGLGAKSFARWETYKTDQSQAADLLLRAIKKGGNELLNDILKEKKIQKKDVA